MGSEWVSSLQQYGLFPLWRAFIVLSPLRDTWASQVVLMVKKLTANAGNREDAGDLSSISRLGRSPGGGNGNPLQPSCLGNPMDRGAWWATVHGVTKSWTRLKPLSWCPVAVTSPGPLLEAMLTKSKFCKILLQTTSLLTQRREPSPCSQRFIWLLRLYQNKVCADQVEQMLSFLWNSKRTFTKSAFGSYPAFHFAIARQISVVPPAIRWVEQNTDRMLFSELLPRMLWISGGSSLC